MSNTKNYVRGSAKLVKTKYGDLLNVSLNLEDLNNLPTYKGFVRVTIAPKQKTDEYGNTHSVFENDFGKPDSTNTD